MALRIPIMRPGEDRAPHADSPDTDLLSSIFDRDVGAFVGDRRQEVITVRQIGMVLLRAADAHKLLYRVVIRRDLLIGDRPILSLTVARISPEISFVEPIRK